MPAFMPKLLDLEVLDQASRPRSRRKLYQHHCRTLGIEPAALET